MVCNNSRYNATNNGPAKFCSNLLRKPLDGVTHLKSYLDGTSTFHPTAPAFLERARIGFDTTSTAVKWYQLWSTTFGNCNRGRGTHPATGTTLAESLHRHRHQIDAHFPRHVYLIAAVNISRRPQYKYARPYA